MVASRRSGPSSYGSSRTSPRLARTGSRASSARSTSPCSVHGRAPARSANPPVLKPEDPIRYRRQARVVGDDRRPDHDVKELIRDVSGREQRPLRWCSLAASCGLNPTTARGARVFRSSPGKPHPSSSARRRPSRRSYRVAHTPDGSRPGTCRAGRRSIGRERPRGSHAARRSGCRLRSPPRSRVGLVGGKRSSQQKG
jgi:hypothetical protein